MTIAVADISMKTASLDIDDIGELLMSFNEVTGRLQATHDALQNQVGALQHELAMANEQLRRSRALAALGEMAAGIAHEIRNPLASVLLDVQGLQDDLRESPEQVEVGDRIAAAVHRIDAIVRDVLAFARDHRVHAAPARP